MMFDSTKKRLEVLMAYVFTVFGAIAIFMSFVITIDKIKLIENPSYIPACTVGSTLNCGTIMATEQASVFGFPNPLIGIAGFAIVITVGMAIFAGAKFKKLYWYGFYAGMAFAIGFVHWLFYESVFDIGALCIYCMVVWACTAPIFYYSYTYGFLEGHFGESKRVKKFGRFLWRYQLIMIALWYMVIAGTILFVFREGLLA